MILNFAGFEINYYYYRLHKFLKAFHLQSHVIPYALYLRDYFVTYFYTDSSYEPGTMRLSNHTNVEHFLRLCLQVFYQAGSPRWVDCWPPWEIYIKCRFQGHKGALPIRESNQGLATFRSLSRRSTTGLLPPYR